MKTTSMTSLLFITFQCFTMIFCFALKKKHDSQQVWIGNYCQHADDLFNPGIHVIFSDLHICILQSEKSFPIVKDEAHVLIEINDNKRLFQFSQNDSLIILTEQY